MKFNLYISFGYPVLKTLTLGAKVPISEVEEDTSDYRDGEFPVAAKLKLSTERENHFCFDCEFETSIQSLEEAIEDEKAAYFLRVQCPNTYFSRVEKMRKKGKLFIPTNELRGATRVDAFIVAIKDATIISDQIRDDFGIKEFDVRAGMVLAHQSPTTHYIEKDYFRPITAVIEFREDPKMKEGEFTIILGDKLGDSVYVKGHLKQIELFQKAIGDGGGSAIFLNSVAFVAVMQMFRGLIADRPSYKSTRWAKVLIAKYDGDINKDMDIVKAAQTILKQPLRSLNERFYSQSQS